MRTLSIPLLLTVAVTLAAPAYGAAYLKLPDIKGEAAQASPDAPGAVQHPDTSQPVGLLLPAVQKVREAAANSADGEKAGKVGEGQK